MPKAKSQHKRLLYFMDVVTVESALFINSYYHFNQTFVYNHLVYYPKSPDRVKSPNSSISESP